MKIPLRWLKDYVSFGVDAPALAHKLTMAGLEVEQIASEGGDTVLEIEITPNRSDCLNILGVAREVGAILNKSVAFPKADKAKYPTAKADITIENKQDCARYVGTIVEGIRISPVSVRIKERIAALGMRGVNNVVDITNFCLMEMGQPLHAFDYDKLSGGKITVRRAKSGEKITTLDGIERLLDPSILVIADAKRPVAIAGIMGGKDTEVTSATKNILLESAYFDPILIRRAARKLGISTDSSYRFERNVAYETVATASQRAASLILSEAGGRVTKYTDLKAANISSGKREIKITLSQIHARLGANISASQCTTIFKKLGFNVKSSVKGFVVVPPEFRQDIKQDVDLTEELARVIGYDQMPSTLPKIQATSISQNRGYALRKQLRDVLIAQGFSPVITYTMLNQNALSQAQQGSLQGIKIQNPLTTDQEMMRPTMLPSALNVVKGNVNRGQNDLRLFEIGKVYHGSREHDTLALITTGNSRKDWRNPTAGKDNFFDFKGAVEACAENLRVDGVAFEATEEGYLEPAEAAAIKINGKLAGIAGKIQSKVLANWDIKQGGVYFAQLNLEEFFAHIQDQPGFDPIPEYPAVGRDVSLAVKAQVTFEQIRQIVRQNGQGILLSLDFKEEYLGDKILAGQRGLVFSLTYQSAKRTLTEAEVNIVHENIVATLVRELGAIRR